MRISRLINTYDNSVIFPKCHNADNFFQRLTGLMFKKGISSDEAFIFHKAGSIHTLFMRFPIDIIFLGTGGKVIKICRGVKPWRAVFCPKALYTIECNNGEAEAKGINENTVLKIEA